MMQGATFIRSVSHAVVPMHTAVGSPVLLSFNSRNPFPNKGYGSIPLFNRARRPSPMSVDRRICIPRASSSSSSESSGPMAPLQLESPVGQFLSQLLYNHPHLLPAAVDQQLDQLKTDFEAEKAKEDSSSASTTDLVLYRRISELKANDRRRALEEILYTLVVQRFMDADVSLVPSLFQISTFWTPEEEKLEQLHSPEVYKMIKNHLSFILGQRLEDLSSVSQISKLQVGQIYAASIMYGYFLKRVDQRFQLEKYMKTLPWGSEDDETTMNYAFPDDRVPSASQSGNPHHGVSSMQSPTISMGGNVDKIKPCRLRAYVLSFDSETLQQYAMIRSKEAFNIIEKHTEALFGKPEIVIMPRGTIDSSKDELVKISFGGLRRLILEAVTFGSFLWDVESYVDTRYHFVVG